MPAILVPLSSEAHVRATLAAEYQVTRPFTPRSRMRERIFGGVTSTCPS